MRPSLAPLLIAAALLLVPAALATAAGPPVYDIPRCEGITIDGNPADWGDRGFRIDALADTAERIRPVSDFDARVRLAWDDRGVLLLAFVNDDVHVEDPRLENLWQKDDVEILLADTAEKGNNWDIAISPGVDPEHPELRYKLVDHRVDAALQKIPLTAEAKRTKTARGYLLEVLLPWANLGIKPQVGGELMLQVRFTDVDSRIRNVSRWFPDDPHPPAPTPLQRIRLAEKAGPPIQAAAWGQYERFRRTRMNVLAAAGLVGKTVDVKEGDRLLASGPLVADETRAVASLTFPMPPTGKPYSALSVTVDGQAVMIRTLPDPDEARHEEIESAEMGASPPIFSSPGFPPCDFEHPAHVEDVIGPYTLTARYYDAAMNEVTSGEKPGRYGAVVEIKTESGEIYHKYVTLFRIARHVDLAANTFKTLDDLPPELGIDPQVARESVSLLASQLRREFSDFNPRMPKAAVLLAGLFEETIPGPGCTTLLTNPQMRDRNWWYQLKKKIGQQKPLPYLVHLPEGYPADATKKWPLLVNIHGGGPNGDDLKKLRPWFNAFVATHSDLPMIYVMPQCPMRESWLPAALNDLLDGLEAKYQVDPDRIYFIGGSMGGIGTWMMGMSYPDRLAAIAPFAGTADPADSPRLKDLPVWAFHGDVDAAVPIAGERKLIDALIKQNARVRYTIYKNGPHDSSSRAIMDPELFTWLLEQRRGHPDQPKAADNPAVITTVPYDHQ